jgi:hypothetical protein
LTTAGLRERVEKGVGCGVVDLSAGTMKVLMEENNTMKSSGTSRKA